MNIFLLFTATLFCLIGNASATTKCFIATENHQTLKQEGDCDTRYSPCSTFKIALSLMGYNEGLLIDEIHPERPFKNGYADSIDVWKQTHNPTSWMKNSCVWYSQVLTKKLGLQKFRNYLRKFQYGNQDASGDRGKNNGLTHAWLSSSLKISPKEQNVFLQKLLNNKLPVSQHAHQMTKKIMVEEDLIDGWKLYGKTGSGNLLNHDGFRNTDRQIGWFIGWIQKEQHTITFVHYIEDENKQDTYASLRAKKAAKEKLIALLKTKE